MPSVTVQHGACPTTGFFEKRGLDQGGDPILLSYPKGFASNWANWWFTPLDESSPTRQGAKAGDENGGERERRRGIARRMLAWLRCDGLPMLGHRGKRQESSISV